MHRLGEILGLIKPKQKLNGLLQLQPLHSERQGKGKEMISQNPQDDGPPDIMQEALFNQGNRRRAFSQIKPYKHLIRDINNNSEYKTSLQQDIYNKLDSSRRSSETFINRSRAKSIEKSPSHVPNPFIELPPPPAPPALSKEDAEAEEKSNSSVITSLEKRKLKEILKRRAEVLAVGSDRIDKDWNEIIKIKTTKPNM